jgi:hypothetical protein
VRAASRCTQLSLPAEGGKTLQLRIGSTELSTEKLVENAAAALKQAVEVGSSHVPLAPH